MVVIAFADATDQFWMRCVNCGLALVEEEGRVWPPALPLRVPRGLAGTELEAWSEVRSALGVNAPTAAVMMCRKLILHVAVSNGLPEKDDKGRGPTFAAAVAHLESEGVVTKRMMPWIDRIKDVGNEANHELPSISMEDAMDVATFTEQLLILNYEMDHLMQNPSSVESGWTIEEM